MNPCVDEHGSRCGAVPGDEIGKQCPACHHVNAVHRMNDGVCSVCEAVESMKEQQ